MMGARFGSWDGGSGLLGGFKRQAPFIIGVAGGTASGKTTVCDVIITSLKDQRVAIISQDSFYRPLTAAERENVSEYNFDHPSAIDWALLVHTLNNLKDPKAGPVDIPVYDFVTHSRLKETTSVYGADVIILEGILIFHHEETRNMFDVKIFVDADADTRLARRVIRDINHRGRDVMGVLRQYEKFVKPSFEEYVSPSKKWADVIIPRGADNLVAINLLVQHIQTKLDERNPIRGNVGKGSPWKK
jgi:uridine kinase